MLPLYDENETRNFPFVTILLIISNIIMFCFSLSASTGFEAFITEWGTVPHRFLHNFSATEVLHALSSMFLHTGFLHLLGNMWFLWIFGDNVEDELGPFKFLFFYVLCGYFAALGHIWSDPGSMVPAVGASGAISGVLAGYIAMHPNAPVRTLLFRYYTTSLPAYTFIGIWFVMQVAFGYFMNSGDNVAWFAHIGGFVAGLLLINLMKPGHEAPEVNYSMDSKSDSWF